MQSDKGGIGSLLKDEDDVVGACLDVFQPLSRELGMRKGHEVVVRPTHLQHGGPYEFTLSPQNKFLLPSATRIYGRARLVHPDGSYLAHDEIAALAPYIPGSLFRNIDIAVNNIHMTKLSNELVHYKNYFEKVLSYGKDAHNSYLNSEHAYPDEPGYFDLHDPTRSPSYRKRTEIIAESERFEFFSDVPSDLFRSDRVMLPKTEIRVTFHLNNERIFVNTNENGPFRLEILDLKLYTLYIELTDELTNMIVKKSLESKLFYPIQRTELKHHSIAYGHSSDVIPNVFRGALPYQVIVTFVTTDAFTGAYNLNPFRFHHFDLSHIDLKVNGSSVPNEPYAMNFQDGQYLRAFASLFENLGIARDNVGNLLTKQAYTNGFFMLAWDLTPDKCAGQHDHLTEQGNISIDVVFQRNLTDPVSMIILGTYNVQLVIDNENEISCEYI